LIVNVGYALLGRGLDLVEGVHIEVVDGTISHIGRGYVSGASMDLRRGIAMPALTNAHLHVLDYAFPEYESSLTLEEAVSEPHGLKHRLLSSLSLDDMACACREVFAKLLRSGATAALVFSELPSAHHIIREEAARHGVEAIVLGRPRGEVGVEGALRDSHGLGLDSPLRFDKGELTKMRELCRAEGKVIATHVAEDEGDYERGDFELALNFLDADVFVHGTHLKEADMEALAERRKAIVVCPRSNMRLRVGLPPLAELLELGVNVLLGTDNAGIVEPDLWREMEAAHDILRLSGSSVSAKEVLKMATVNAERVEALKVSSAIEEGGKANFIILDAYELGVPRSRDVYASLVKRGSPTSILKVIRGEVYE
jgi:cytosine/adenosine deaminase-related metal-dependent hydrolase